MKPTDFSKTNPVHVAIIMDGNGRWAAKRGLPRTAGHKAGVESTRRVVEAAADLGIQYLTLFGFSTENWSRPEKEVKELMQLLRYYLRSETASLHDKGACLKIIGSREALDDDIVQLIENAESLMKDNNKITVVIALNYGGRQDIIAAAKAMALGLGDAIESMDSAELEDAFSSRLTTSGIPDPDLLIRTSGEQRISNFLLWQCAYAEFVFSPTLWPDFNKDDLQQALNDFGARDRRFGAVKASV
ncbi:MAG: polyprenyl diphosphate synthase [Pseudomonadota bacterium]